MLSWQKHFDFSFLPVVPNSQFKTDQQTKLRQSKVASRKLSVSVGGTLFPTPDLQCKEATTGRGRQLQLGPQEGGISRWIHAHMCGWIPTVAVGSFNATKIWPINVCAQMKLKLPELLSILNTKPRWLFCCTTLCNIDCFCHPDRVPPWKLFTQSCRCTHLPR